MPTPTVFNSLAPLDPHAKGLTLSKDRLTKDHGNSKQFTVDDQKGVGLFKFVNEEPGGEVKNRTATISTGPGNTGEILKTYTGRQTTTDEPHGQYISKNHPESAASLLYLHLDPAKPYWYNYWNDDLSAGGVVSGHNNNNNL